MDVLTAGAVATQAKVAIYHFPEGRISARPVQDRVFNEGGLSMPIVDKSYWNGRYVYCELSLETEEGLKLTTPIAIVSISKTKQIVCTQLVGQAGTVKEYISDGDYEISISIGLQATDEDGRIVDLYPEEALRDLNEIVESDKPITVYSKFFELFDIDRIVIKSYSMEQETHSNIQNVGITAISDNEYNVYSEDY